MAQNESPKPSAHTQQKESQGKEKTNNSKGSRENDFKETISVSRVTT